jgi:hypothetical protein
MKGIISRGRNKSAFRVSTNIRNRDSSVSVLTRLRAGESRIVVVASTEHLGCLCCQATLIFVVYGGIIP